MKLKLCIYTDTNHPCSIVYACPGLVFAFWKVVKVLYLIFLKENFQYSSQPLQLQGHLVVNPRRRGLIMIHVVVIEGRSFPSVKTFVVGAKKNRLIETVLLSTHNMFWLRNM